LCDLNIA
jgi:apoptosis-inducing factor 3